MALLILALLQRIFLMSSLMLLLVWLIFFMVLIKLLPILGTISRSEERFSRNAETDLVCRLLLEKKKQRLVLAHVRLQLPVLSSIQMWHVSCAVWFSFMYVFFLGFFFVVAMIGLYIFFFFFNDTATTEIYTLSLHDALPI